MMLLAGVVWLAAQTPPARSLEEWQDHASRLRKILGSAVLWPLQAAQRLMAAHGRWWDPR